LPRVPVYEGPTVEPRALPTPRSDSVVTPELLSGGARQQAQLGDALMRAGKAGMDVLTDMRERETADTVFRAEAGLREDHIAYEQEMREKRQGRYASGITEDSKRWFDDRIRKRGEELTNPNARRIFAQRAAGLRAQGLDSASRWEAVQLERSHDEGWAADKKSVLGSAAANPTPENIDNARGELARLNRYQASRRGWEGSRLEAEHRTDTTELHKNVIQTLAVNDPAGAQEYFEKWKTEIDGAQHAELGAFAEKVSANAIGDQVAEAIWSKHGPKSDTDPVNLDELTEKARKALEKNEPAKSAALSALRERTISFDKGVREREAANASAVSQAALNGATVRQIRAMPEFQRLSGTKQLAMIEHVENTTYTRGQWQRQAAEQREADLARQNNAAYFKYSDPEALRSMSRNEVLGLLPELGRLHTQNLLTRWDALNGDKQDARLSEAKMDRDDFNRIAHAAGLKPYDPATRRNEDKMALLGELHSRIENLIGEEQQQRLKRTMTRAEKNEFMQREIDNKVLVDRWGRDPTKPVILLTPGEMEKAYVVVDGQQVKLSSIPAEDREEIILARQKRGMRVTEADIARTWLKSDEFMQRQSRRRALVTQFLPADPMRPGKASASPGEMEKGLREAAKPRPNRAEPSSSAAATDRDPMPAAARPVIEQFLQRKKLPIDDATVRQVWQDRIYFVKDLNLARFE
jgi:hypothetical protein